MEIGVKNGVEACRKLNANATPWHHFVPKAAPPRAAFRLPPSPLTYHHLYTQ